MRAELKAKTKDLLGRALGRVLPSDLTEGMREEWFAARTPRNVFERVMWGEFQRQYYALPEHELRRLNRDRFWANADGKKWFEEHDDVRLEQRKALVNQLREVLDELPGTKTVIEVGAGSGRFLEWLGNEGFGEGRSLVGIDLNAAQMADNNERFPGLTFIAGEIQEWLKSNPLDGVVVIAVGTLQYFTPSELQDFFRLMATGNNTTRLVFAEVTNLDLARETESRPRKRTAFSHHYEHLMNGTGLTLTKKVLEDVGSGSQPYVRLTATCKPS